MIAADGKRETGILMSEQMVLRTLDGSKTETRRVAKVPLTTRAVRWVDAEETIPSGQYTGWVVECDAPLLLPVTCPYGQPGDRLWVRETWGVWHREDATPGGRPYDPSIVYRADDPDYEPDDYSKAAMIAEPWRWRPSIHMRRKDARILLAITQVRVERVQDISLADVNAEGVGTSGTPFIDLANARGHFARLWNGLNEGRGFSFETNPWVWVLSFKRVEKAAVT